MSGQSDTTRTSVNEHTVSAPIKVRPQIAAAPVYKQGKAPAKLGFKLSSNENHYEPLPSVLAAISDLKTINRYASPDHTELKVALADYLNTELQTLQTNSDSQDFATGSIKSKSENTYKLNSSNIHLGSGSVNILYQLLHAVAGADDNYIYAWPSFEAYPLLGLASGATAKPIPLTAAAKHDLAAMASAVDERTRAILLCSPNNPTGPIITDTEFSDFMALVPQDTLVVLDEAYAEYVTAKEAVNGLKHLEAHPNLVVLRTFAKAHGLAGLRIGYAAAHPALWQQVAPTNIPLSINVLAEAAALATLQPQAQQELQKRTQKTVQLRTQFIEKLIQLDIQVPQAQGNYVWIAQTQIPAPALKNDTEAQVTDAATALAAYLAQQGLLVRPFAGHGVRITVAEPESIDAVVSVIGEYLKMHGK